MAKPVPVPQISQQDNFSRIMRTFRIVSGMSALPSKADKFFLALPRNKTARNGWMPLRCRYCSASQYHCAQVLPFHRAHLRAWRLSCLDTQTPLTRVLPTPHPATICVMMLSGSSTGATGIACADVVTIKTKAAKAINLNMPFSCSFLTTHNRGSLQGCPVGSAVLNYKITQKILFLGAISPETREVAAALTVGTARAPNIRVVSRANKLFRVYFQRSRLPSKNRHPWMRSNCALRIQKRTNAPHNRSSRLCWTAPKIN